MSMILPVIFKNDGDYTKFINVKLAFKSLAGNGFVRKSVFHWPDH